VFTIGTFYGIQSSSDKNKYVDIPGESTKIYTEIIVYDYNGNLNQKWKLL